MESGDDGLLDQWLDQITNVCCKHWQVLNSTAGVS